MATIIQYIPAFFSGFPRKEETFESQEELLSIPFVRGFSEHENGAKDEYFHQYSINIRNNNLMAECDNGKKWYVIGSIDDVTMLTLPEWEPVYEENTP